MRCFILLIVFPSIVGALAAVDVRRERRKRARTLAHQLEQLSVDINAATSHGPVRLHQRSVTIT